MHKAILNLFGFLKNTAHFLKVVIVFCILMLLLYWIDNLANFNWTWLNFIKPVLDTFINIGASFSKASLKLFSANFELKYFIALLLFLVTYVLAHFIFIGLNYLEELYCDGRRFAKKVEEKIFNAKLEHSHTVEQKKINSFGIYVEPIIKNKFNVKTMNINLEEQALAMNKYLIGKTGASPVKFENGYLYKFTPFDNIDDTLKAFFSLYNQEAPMDYIICVQVLDNEDEDIPYLKKLIELRLLNKIVAWSDTIYRYSFNDICQYETSQIGIYQVNGTAREAHEFEKKYL